MMTEGFYSKVFFNEFHKESENINKIYRKFGRIFQFKLTKLLTLLSTNKTVKRTH